MKVSENQLISMMAYLNSVSISPPYSYFSEETKIAIGKLLKDIIDQQSEELIEVK